ncbi:DUF2306 domain-containing protein [Polaromonas naphthalenivorans]|uniref:DUF2306 domain-containing protein n=1 Tax=Polaromonas naphthalenivorans (strain CJ2) TaxID=365044 RepID=A1VW89_POLNA|nr:DUF2306 domain-containing protein [Polaromonas naphthalenivorans]ABM39917.1 hypothetical protein Pnap_4852 [Polaromonas naphthalenivorans CJ2]
MDGPWFRLKSICRSSLHELRRTHAKRGFFGFNDAMPLVGFTALVILSLGVAGYAVGVYGFLPLGVALHPDMRAAFEAHRIGVYAHVFTSAVALALGPVQFSARFRAARPGLHRWLGRLYLGVGVLVGGVAGLFMAFHAFGGLAARLGFGCLAALWLYTGFRAYRAIRARDIAAHRRWMVRNFALTFAAVTLRLWMPASMVLGIPFENAYPVIAWLCWIPNLVLAELAFNQARNRATRPTMATEPGSAAQER